MVDRIVWPRLRPCRHCSAEFQSRGYAHRHCTSACRVAALSKGIRPCEHCGAGFNWHPTMRPRFCSKDCANKARRKPNGRFKQCSECDTLLATMDARKFCSGRCAAREYGRLRRARRLLPTPRPLASCARCGAAPVAKQGAKYCSAKCRLMRPPATRLIACRICGVEFTVGNHQANRVYCTRKCYYGSSEYAQKKKPAIMKREALKRGVAAESIRPQDIYRRDRWRCGICGGSVDKALKFPDRMSASLDHIVPLAAGGDHTRINVQLAHMGCNAKKGARGGGQLRLIG